MTNPFPCSHQSLIRKDRDGLRDDVFPNCDKPAIAVCKECDGPVCYDHLADDGCLCLGCAGEDDGFDPNDNPNEDI